jgi:hypothetical protein
MGLVKARDARGFAGEERRGCMVFYRGSWVSSLLLGRLAVGGGGGLVVEHSGARKETDGVGDLHSRVEAGDDEDGRFGRVALLHCTWFQGCSPPDFWPRVSPCLTFSAWLFLSVASGFTFYGRRQSEASNGK